MRKSLTDIFNEIYTGHHQVVRFFKLSYPIYLVPINVLERNTTDEYNVLEYYIDKFIVEGRVSSFDELIHLLGMKGHEYSVGVMLKGLEDINHIEEINHRLYPTTLAVESIKNNKKITNKTTSRKIYFDCINNSPIPKQYYNQLRPVDLNKTKNKNNYILDIPDYIFHKTQLKSILKFNGVQRDYYGLPQEMVDIDFDLNNESEIKIAYITLYCALSNDNSIVLYRPYYNKVDEYFTHVINRTRYLCDNILRDFYVEPNEDLIDISNDYYDYQNDYISVMNIWKFNKLSKTKAINLTNQNELNKLNTFIQEVLNGLNNISINNMIRFLENVIKYDEIVTDNKWFGHVISVEKNEQSLVNLLDFYKQCLEKQYQDINIIQNKYDDIVSHIKRKQT